MGRARWANFGLFVSYSPNRISIPAVFRFCIHLARRQNVRGVTHRTRNADFLHWPGASETAGRSRAPQPSGAQGGMGMRLLGAFFDRLPPGECGTERIDAPRPKWPGLNRACQGHLAPSGQAGRRCRRTLLRWGRRGCCVYGCSPPLRKLRGPGPRR